METKGRAMNDLTTQTTQLPDTIEDLTQFVLVGKATLQAYMMKLQTVNRLSVAQEIRDQTLKEAQEVSTAVIAAEQRIGELLLAIPKQAGATNFSRDEEKLKTKGETIKEMGYGKNEANDYQQMAKHPEVVQKVIENALANGDVVSKSSVMKEIKVLKEENERLRDDNRTLAKRSEPQVIEKEVIKVVTPDDYEKVKEEASRWQKAYSFEVKEHQRVTRENLELNQKIRELQNPTTEEKIVDNAKEEMEYFTIATYKYIKNYGGHVWAFDKYKDVPKDTRDNFNRAIMALAAFSQQLSNNLGGLCNG